MARAKIADADGIPAVLAVRGGATDRSTRALAVRYTLQLLAERAEGNTVEVRVPPFGATQCIPGPRHTRGTPPNVVEMDADTWLELADGRLDFADALAAARISASGTRASLEGVLPVVPAAILRAAPDEGQ